MRTKFKAETLYRKHRGVITSKAYSFSCTTNMSCKELIGEGNFIFMESLLKWNPERGSFNTFFHTKLTNAFKDLNNRKNIISFLPPKALEELNARSNITPFDRLAFKDTIENMTKEAKEVVQIVLEGPIRVGLELQKITKGVVKTEIRKKLRKKGWKWNAIEKTFNEIKLALKEF